MNTGSKRKHASKGANLYVHKIASSATISVSDDDRRLKIKKATFGESSKTPVASQHPEDLATLEAVGNLDSFSYLLGQDLPVGPDDLDLGFDDSDAIQVTLKSKRNDKSVSVNICQPLLPLTQHIPTGLSTQCMDTVP